MARAILIVLDSAGVGGAPDADKFGDEGANTIGHIAKECLSDFTGSKQFRTKPLCLPNLDRLGLGAILRASIGTNAALPGLDYNGKIGGLWGCATEISNGKDTPSGHWEIAGVPVLFDWGYFPDTKPCFPEDLTNSIIKEAELTGILGNKHASGTDIIVEFGKEHILTDSPILYTSADSVLQIAAHEQYFGIERLYKLCEICRNLVNELNIGRVIARPFVGSDSESFRRTGNRRDYSVEPPNKTLLDRAVSAGRNVFAVGKISDIFAHRGVSKSIRGGDNFQVWNALYQAMSEAGKGDLIFVNFVDFDMLYGHRRDVFGYAAALEEFDQEIPKFASELKPDDLVVITADHGCDPTWKGTDHTRERVPILAFGPKIASGPIGVRKTFADIGESVGSYLGLPKGSHGHNFISGGKTK